MYRFKAHSRSDRLLPVRLTRSEDFPKVEFHRTPEHKREDLLAELYLEPMHFDSKVRAISTISADLMSDWISKNITPELGRF